MYICPRQHLVPVCQAIWENFKLQCKDTVQDQRILVRQPPNPGEGPRALWCGRNVAAARCEREDWRLPPHKHLQHGKMCTLEFWQCHCLLKEVSKSHGLLLPSISKFCMRSAY